ncbi:hypothetical protein J3454_08845 [Erythrobacter sp. NFXS35]|uniref:hypothetical protein n=1 Tax=Erythrobacter sp. NFXS35 TaxID=2818436 RepID=UPI0032DF93DE
MGNLLGLPEWVSVTAFAAFALAIWMGFGFWGIRRAHAEVAARRPNPTEAEFLTMMADDCSPQAAQFLWGQATFYVSPGLTPHPDDDLIKDLRIDDDDIAMDWPRAWAEQRGFAESDQPEWPEDWPVTARNFGRWLDQGPRSGTSQSD